MKPPVIKVTARFDRNAPFCVFCLTGFGRDRRPAFGESLQYHAVMRITKEVSQVIMANRARRETTEAKPEPEAIPEPETKPEGTLEGKLSLREGMRLSLSLRPYIKVLG